MATFLERLPLACLLLLTACGGKSSESQSASLADTEAVADTKVVADAKADGYSADSGDMKPKDDVEYINETTGDVWGFVPGVPDDGEDPLDFAWFRGNGMQGRNIYEMRRVPCLKGTMRSLKPVAILMPASPSTSSPVPTASALRAAPAWPYSRQPTAWTMPSAP